MHTWKGTEKMNWIEIWAMIQVIGIAIPFVVIGLIIIYEIARAILRKAQEK
jgi:hypothetical protein